MNVDESRKIHAPSMIKQITHDGSDLGIGPSPVSLTHKVDTNVISTDPIEAVNDTNFTGKKAIEVNNLSISFNKKCILHDITWQIPQGKITTLIGPNGCGKSTLLKAMVGYNHSITGSIRINGKNIGTYSRRALAQYLAFLPQTPDIPKDMIVEELVGCGRFPYQNWWKNTAKEDREIISESLEFTKVTHLRKQLVSSLSGGERQRVWIAMALAQNPKMLVLDEPTTYLDINHQFEIMELLRRLNKERHMTVLMVLHELNQAARYSHQIAVIHQGTLALHGTPEAVMTKHMLRDIFMVNGDVRYENDQLSVQIHGLL